MLIRTCEMCGGEFETNHPRQKYCRKEKVGRCIVCGKEYKYICATQYSRTCGDPECARLASSKLKPSKTKMCKGCGREFVPKSYRSSYCGELITAICSICGKEFQYKCEMDAITDKCPDCVHKYKKVCLYCGKEFITDTFQKQVCDGVHYKVCPVCGKEFIADNDRLYEDLCCSDECAKVRRKVSIKRALNGEPKGWNIPKTIYRRTCRICGQPFETRVYNNFICDRDHYLQCGVCGKSVLASRTQLLRGHLVCGPTCAAIKAKQTSQRKYGVDNYTQTQEYRDRVANSYEDIKAKTKKSNIARFGQLSVSGTDEWLKKFMTDPHKLNNLRKFIDDPEGFIHSNFEVKPTINMLCKLTGINATSMGRRIHASRLEHLVEFTYSTMEKEVYQFLIRELSEKEIILRDRTVIGPQEIDVYVPGKLFGVECNPTASHNSSFTPWDRSSRGISPSYHKDKSTRAEQAGVFLFHMFGYEWIHKRSIMESMLRSCIGTLPNRIFARNCVVREVSQSEARLFLNTNHRQGYLYSKLHFGLYLDSKLVAIMSFTPMRPTIGVGKSMPEGCWELTRFCSLLNTQVVGAASKLFSYFQNNCSISCVRSFSDIARTKGNVYPLLGFELVGRSEPGYRWVQIRTDRDFSRVNAQKSNIKKFLHDENIDLSLSERELMESHGFAQVFDCGTKVWEWNR